MSCGAPLFSYSRFLDDDGGAEDPPSGTGATILIVVIVVVLVIAGICCWCFSRQPGGGCGGGQSGRSGGRALAGGGLLEVATFEELQAQEKCVAMFHAEWCGHCKATKPAFASAAKRASVPFLLVDTEKVLRPDQMQKYGITGFPTILMMAKGAAVGSYNGDRTEESFVQFALG